MEQVHLDNLAKLRDFLMTNQLPFEMSTFRCTAESAGTGDGDIENLTKDILEAGVKSCGTAGCAVGWAPFVIAPDESLFSFADGTMSHMDYSARHLGVRPCDPEWNWLFAGLWANVDNTRLGAAYRLDVYLKSGIPTGFTNPNHWDDEELQAYNDARDKWIAETGAQ